MSDQIDLENLACPDDRLLDEIVGTLKLRDGVDPEALKVRLCANVRQYDGMRQLRKVLLNVHEDRKRAQKLLGHVDALIEGLPQFSPIIGFIMSGSVRDDEGKEIERGAIESQLGSLRKGLAVIARSHPPNRLPDLVQEDAIGKLMALLFCATGNLASAREADASSGRPPELSNPEARAIARLIRVAQPKLGDQNFVTRIRRLSRKHGENIVQAYWHEQFSIATITPF